MWECLLCKMCVRQGSTIANFMLFVLQHQRGVRIPLQHPLPFLPPHIGRDDKPQKLLQFFGKNLFQFCPKFALHCDGK